MEYDLGDSVVNAGTVGAVESDGGGESNSVTSLLSTSRRGSQDYLSDDGTLVASEHDHSDGHSDGGMSSWIARELELHYNGSNATTATNNDIEETDQPTHLETVSPLCSSFRQQTPSASSLGKRSRENSDVDSETLTGNGTTTQVHPDNDAGSPSSTTSSAANQCRAAKKIMTSKPEAHHRDIRRHATMAPPLHPRSPLEYDRAPSPQPLESPHAVQVQPREGLPEHLFAGSFEKDFRDDFARPKPAEQTSRDNITLKIATGELEGDSGPSTAAPASASFPDIGQAEQLSPPAQKTPVTTSAPATTSTATVSPIVLPDVLSVLASRRYSVHGDNQELTAGQRSANNHHLNHHRLDHHHRAVSQDPAHQAQLQYQNFDMDMSLQRLQGMEAAPRSSQTIRSYQSMQAMHAKQAAQELQALQNMEAVDAFSSAQGLPGMPLISPELLEATMPSMPAPSNQHRQLPLLENTPSYVGYNFQPDMPSEVQTEVVEEYSETDQFEIPDMAVTGMGMVDFANPEEIARVMGGINDTESGHDSFRAVHFPWPPN
ncbi:hypothetical protein SBRCBS47491_009978 [Sporothrix bragantina]|uniref:Uncharacterized protein n=1 Tax=Sporothrix bragantina TaxID=671064 RepID=A0ABP0CZT3_9PEZI